MSATICWRPSAKNDKHLNVGAPSSFMEVMKNAGFGFPCAVTLSDVPVLRGMAAVYGRNDQNPNPFDELLDLVEKYGSIELWAVY